MAFFASSKLKTASALVIGACSAWYAERKLAALTVPNPKSSEDDEEASIEDIISKMPDDYEFNYPWILVTCKEIPPIGESEQRPWAFAVIDANSQEPVARSGEGFASQAEALHAGEKVAAFFDRAQAERESSETAKQIEAGSKRQLMKAPEPPPLQLGGYI